MTFSYLMALKMSLMSEPETGSVKTLTTAFVEIYRDLEQLYDKPDGLFIFETTRSVGSRHFQRWSCFDQIFLKTYEYKKVLLRERERHIARRIASARYASGGGGGYPIQSWWGVPHPVMVGRYPI